MIGPQDLNSDSMLGLQGLNESDSIASFNDDRISRWLSDNKIKVDLNKQLFFDFANLEGTDAHILMFIKGVKNLKHHLPQITPALTNNKKSRKSQDMLAKVMDLAIKSSSEFMSSPSKNPRLKLPALITSRSTSAINVYNEEWQTSPVISTPRSAFVPLLNIPLHHSSKNNGEYRLKREGTIQKLKRFASLKQKSVDDIMDIYNVRKNCIRVYGRDATRVINIYKQDANTVKSSIFKKFNIKSDIKPTFALYTKTKDDVFQSVDDAKLATICFSPSKQRSSLYILRNPYTFTRKRTLPDIPTPLGRPNSTTLHIEFDIYFPNHDLLVNKDLPALPAESYLPRPISTSPSCIPWLKSCLIGQGSFGKVYLGINTTTQEFMAIKQVQIKQTKLVLALQQEISLLRTFNHPHIVRYYGFDVEESVVSLFMEYVSGFTLTSLKNQVGKFADELVVFLGMQILDGLAYMHSVDVIHRDIKGANGMSHHVGFSLMVVVLVNEEGFVKISDFGISKRNEYQAAYRLNRRMSVQGSVYWMSPEIFQSKGYSAKVDIWSFGCVMLEMVSGQRPWYGNDEIQTIWKLNASRIPDIPDNVTDEMHRVINSCLQVDPDNRPTASELLDLSLFAIDAEFDFEVYTRKAMEERHVTRSTITSSSSDESY